MKERPILFSGPMVRAFLDGRKTMTRRVARLNTAGRAKAPGKASNWHCDDPDAWQACPYGAPGDRLWVRETWCQKTDDGYLVYNDAGDIDSSCCHYAADGHEVFKSDGDGGTEWRKDGTAASPWKPSIHMPRWASRITLEVTGVRVERLQSVTEEDAQAEGVEPLTHIGPDQPILDNPRIGRTAGSHPHVLSLAVLWDEINGDRAPWSSNPWAWVVEFKRLK